MSHPRRRAHDRSLLMGDIVDQLSDAVVAVDASQKIIFANRATSVLFGHAPRDLPGMDLAMLMPERFRSAHRKGFAAYLASRGQRRLAGYVDVVGMDRHGREFPVSLSMTYSETSGEGIVTGVMRDMSEIAQAKKLIDAQNIELRAANERLEQLAMTDPLTGALNRRSLQQLLASAWAASSCAQAPISFLLCDIDFFKPYNDAYGHLQGDRCLAAVARALQARLGLVGKVARFGGEEFAAVIQPPAGSHPADWAEAARLAVLALQLPHRGSRVAEVVSVSVGIATHHPSHQEAQDLIRCADDALYAAKHKRNTWVAWQAVAAG